jgi:hypothetical protein
MPTTVSGLTFYEEQFETGLYQGLTQAVDGFNAASGGAIMLANGAAKGRKPLQTFFQHQAGLMQSRDPSGTGTLTPVKVGNAEHASIKAFDAAPMTFTSQDWEDMGMSDTTGTFLYGVMYGESLAERLLNAAISALIGATQAIGATAVHDYSGTGALDYGVLNTALGKMGDRRQSLRTLVAYSKPLTDLIGQAFTSQQVAFQLGSATIYSGAMPTLGLGVVNTDAPPLFVDLSGTDHYWTLALVPGAISLKTGPSRRIFNVITGSATATPENHTWLLSIESSFEIKVRGVSYTGAALPNNAALATSGNWTHVTGSAAQVKNGPGIAIKTQ